jgi:hypothetical protein
MTPDEHNKLRWSELAHSTSYAGVACPRCDPQQELVFSRPGELLLSWPPQKLVHCANCDYTGTIVQ